MAEKPITKKAPAKKAAPRKALTRKLSMGVKKKEKAIEEFGNKAPLERKKGKPSAKKKAVPLKKVSGSLTQFSLKLSGGEIEQVEDLRRRAALLGLKVPTKTGVFRAGLVALAKASDSQFKITVNRVVDITKPGPK